MRREVVEMWSDARGSARRLIAYGHWGRPLLLFPAAGGSAFDPERHGLVDAVRGLVDEGRVKVYAVDSPDTAVSSGHADHEAWLFGEVVPWIHTDCRGPLPILAAGVGTGACLAVDVALKRADLVPEAVGLSGSYVNGPADYVRHLGGDHLDWLRSRLFLLLVVGEVAGEEHPARALSGTREMAGLLAATGIPHELAVWGPEWPLDWTSWRAQLATYLPRFV